jgi:tetratricopeptide (TPR) repeat protein
MKQMLFRKLLIILIFCLPALNLSAQNSRLIDSLETALSSSTEPLKQIEIKTLISEELVNSDVSKSLEIGLEALKLADESSSKEGMIIACMHLAKVYFVMSDLDKAMEYALQAKNLSEELHLDNYLAQSMDAIGSIYYDIGNQAKSSENFFASLKIYESLKDKEGIGSTYCRIGTLYLDQKDYDKAAEYYSSSIRIAREINLPMGIASNLNNLAKVYYSKGDYPKALENYNEALKINLETGNIYMAGLNYLNISDVFSRLQDYTTAIKNLNQARDIFESLGNKLRFAKSLAMLGEVYLKTGSLSKSEELARKALEIGQSQDFKEIIISAAGVLYTLNLDRKDSAIALTYFLLEKQYQDSLALNEKQKTLSALELQYQFDKKEQSLKIARQRRTIIIMVISGGVFFSLIFLVLLIKHLRLKAKKLQLEKAGFERELEFKNKELVLNVMSLMQKNEILSDLSEKLISIDESATTPESKETIKKVARELQKSQDKEIWKEFSHRFKEVHGEFYDNLLLKYPDLTPNELKLCAFLRLNMSSKDIAELTGQRVSSLETARYRLRQKLGIANSDVNLVTFLSSI